MEGESASYYDVLNLDRRASSAEVDQAFFKVDEAFRAIGAGWEGEAAAGTDGIREAYNVRLALRIFCVYLLVKMLCLLACQHVYCFHK